MPLGSAQRVNLHIASLIAVVFVRAVPERTFCHSYDTFVLFNDTLLENCDTLICYKNVKFQLVDPENKPLPMKKSWSDIP